MKLSKIFHVIGAIVGWVGVIALLSAWFASKNGLVLGMSETHLFMDAIVLVLVAIWLQLGTIHHMMLEKTGEKI